MEHFDILYLKDVSEELRISRRTLYYWMKASDEKHFFKLGGRNVILRENLKDFVNANIRSGHEIK